MGIKITAKQLYVSGSAISINSTNQIINLHQCTSIFPIIEPQIEYQIEYGVITTIIIQIMGMQNITHNQIQNLLTNMTENIIDDRIHALDINTECIVSYNIKITEIEQHFSLINATIFLCKKQEQTRLSVDFEQNLESDFIQRIGNETTVNASDINVEISNVDKMRFMEPSSTNNGAMTLQQSMDFIDLMMSHIVYIAISVAAMCLFCIIMPIVCRQCHRQKKDKMDEIGGNDHSVPMMQLKTESVSIVDDERAQLVAFEVNKHDNERLGIRRHKESDSLFVRYPGDDETFKERMNRITPGRNVKFDDDEDECNPNIQNDEFIVNGDDDIENGPGFSMKDEQILNLSDDEFIVDSDHDKNVTTRY